MNKFIKLLIAFNLLAVTLWVAAVSYLAYSLLRTPL